MESIRSFISVEIPEKVKSRMLEVKKELVPLTPYIRWVRPESMHLTLKFLGDIDPSQVEPVSACIEEVVKGVWPFEVKVGGAGVFPNSRYPRVLWIGIVEGQEQLSSICRGLEEGLKKQGFKPESRPFRPHLTLGRFKDGRKAGRALSREMLEQAATWEEGFAVNGVKLMRSQLHPSGAIYTVLKECTLSGET